MAYSEASMIRNKGMVENLVRKPLSHLQLTQEARSFLGEMIRNLPQDFAPDRPGYYSHESRELLYAEAARRLAHRLSATSGSIDFAELRSAWTEVVVDYHRNNNWNYPVSEKKPEKILTQDQETARELWPYIWVLIQSGILLKTAVYYFGINSASEPSRVNTVMLVLALLISFGSLFFFAWRKSRK